MCRGGRIPNVWTFRLWEFSTILEHLPFLAGYKQILHPAACPAHPGSLDMKSMTFAAVICDADDPCSSGYCIRSRIIFHNITSEYNSTFVLFGALSPIRHSLNDRCPSVKQNELLRPSSLLHRSPLSLLLTFVRFHAGIFSNFSHSLSTAAFASGIIHGLRHWHKFVYQITKLQ